MNCNECIERSDEYLENRLAATEAEQLRRHLAICPSCADELESIRELRDRAAALPRSLEPEHDLWPGIAARITENRVVHGRFGRRALLVAAAAVVVVSSVVTAYLIGRSQATANVELATLSDGAPSEMLLASFEELGVNNYLATRTQLLNALEERKHELSPETMDVVMENLVLIDQAMNRIAEALGEDPDNEFLMKQLVGAYRRQVDLLERAVRMPAEV